MHGVHQEPDLVNNMTPGTHRQHASGSSRRRSAFHRNTSLERTRQTTKDARTERSQLNNSPGGGTPLVEGTRSEVVGRTAVIEDVFAGAWSCELAELSLADAVGDESRDELDGRPSAMQHSWVCMGSFDQTTGDWCSPDRATPRSKNVQHHGGLCCEKELPHNKEAQGATSLTLMPRRNGTDHSISGSV